MSLSRVAPSNTTYLGFNACVVYYHYRITSDEGSAILASMSNHAREPTAKPAAAMIRSFHS
ncbi:hypothetical protein BN1723_009808, partial [Verticillium longisporum]